MKPVQGNKGSISYHKQHKPEALEQSLPLPREKYPSQRGCEQEALGEVISESMYQEDLKLNT